MPRDRSSQAAASRGIARPARWTSRGTLCGIARQCRGLERVYLSHVLYITNRIYIIVFFTHFAFSAYLFHPFLFHHIPLIKGA
jgi:hypothetical protein